MPRSPRPRMGWHFREVLDAKLVAPDEVVRCEVCNHELRWIHLLSHDAYWKVIEVGCCCALRLSTEYDAVEAEREAKNRSGRLMRFIDPSRWRRSHNNPLNIWRFVKLAGRKRLRCTVYLKDGGYGIYLEGTSHFDRYATADEAKAIAFQLVERAGR